MQCMITMSLLDRSSGVTRRPREVSRWTITQLAQADQVTLSVCHASNHGRQSWFRRHIFAGCVLWVRSRNGVDDRWSAGRSICTAGIHQFSERAGRRADGQARFLGEPQLLSASTNRRGPLRGSGLHHFADSSAIDGRVVARERRQSPPALLRPVGGSSDMRAVRSR